MTKETKQRPILAVCYDFDKTLTPTDMQAQGYIQSVGCDVEKFWSETDAMAAENDMDSNLAYMLKMAQEAEGNIIFNRKTLAEYGSRVELFPGAETWFDRVNAYGDACGLTVEHYIISSGLREMIEGTALARRGVFRKIYASAFYYNERGVAVWPAQVVNYTGKTQFLFRISKGVLDVNDAAVNDYFPPGEMRVPFRNIVYIGDSDTDIPCMKLVNSMGGYSVGVYSPYTKDDSKVRQLLREGRVRYIAEADYSEGKELETLMKEIMAKTAASEALERRFHDALKK